MRATRRFSDLLACRWSIGVQKNLSGAGQLSNHASQSPALLSPARLAVSKPTDELMRAIGTDHWIRVPGLITCGTDTAETGRLEFVVDGRRSPRKRTEDTSTSGAKPSPGNFEDSGGEAAVSSAGAVPAGSTSPVVVDLNGLRVASVPLPGFALHEVKGGRASLIASGSTTWCGTSTQRGTRRGAGGPRPGRRRPGLPSPGVGGTARRVRVHHFPAEERDSLLVVASQSRDWLPSHGRPPPPA